MKKISFNLLNRIIITTILAFVCVLNCTIGNSKIPLLIPNTKDKISLHTSETNSPNPFLNKRIGVYISKKNLKFNTEYYKTLSAFIGQEDTIGLSSQEINLGMSVRLGMYLTEKLTKVFKADSAFFVNENPNIARGFLKVYNNPNVGINSLLKTLPQRIDYILILEGLNLYTEDRNNLATYSNQIFTQKRKIKRADLTLRILNLKTGKLSPPTVVNFDEENSG